MKYLFKKAKNFYNNLGIQHKLTFSHLIIVLVPMIVVGIFFQIKLYDMIVSDTIRDEQELSAKTAPLIEDLIDEVITTHRRLRATPFYKAVTDENRDTDFKTLSASESAKDFAHDVAQYTSTDALTSVRIYIDCPTEDIAFYSSRKHNIIQPLDNAKRTYWYGIFQGSPAMASLLCPSFYLSNYEIENYGDLAYITKDTITQNGEKYPCYIVTYFSNTYMTKLLRNNINTHDNAAYIINSRDNLVAASNQSLYGTYPFSCEEIRENIMSSNNFITKEVLGETVYAGFYRIESTDWYMVVVMPAKPMLTKSNGIIATFLLIYVAFLFLAFLIATYLSRSMTKRLSLVINQMAKVRIAPPVKLPDADSQDEIGELIDTYNYMSDKIHDLMKTQADTAENLRIAEFDSLQSQINPHFLYNTMDMISWLAQQGKTEEVSEVVRRLSRFYRLTLSHKKGLTTIEKELEHVTIYVELQNMRFNDSIDFIVDIPDQLLEYSIPKLIFQPLVENSILHGILEKEDKTGSIVLTGWLEENDIVILISDDGIGIDPTIMDQLLSGDFHSSQSKGTNIAVYNTHRRLQILYGDKYGLSYSKVPDSGTEVQIRIPAISSETTEICKQLDSFSSMAGTPNASNTLQQFTPETHDFDSKENSLMNYAVTLLNKPGLSIYEIAWCCGYKDIQTFYREFFDVYGYTPEEYRMHML